MDWDDKIGDLTSRWNNISSLKSMEKIIIDRCIYEITDTIILMSLHVFMMLQKLYLY